jgi:hypothetical protein
MRPAFDQSIEQNIIEEIGSDLRLFGRQQKSYKFLCPYCQTGQRTSKGKSYARGDAKGYLYQIGNAWNFKCHKSNCPTRTLSTGGKSFERFLADHFPHQHFQYVRQRDALGLTGYQSNCPTLGTVLKSKNILGNQPPQFGSRFQGSQAHPPKSINGETLPAAPKVTQLPPMRSPQQQAGHQSRLNQRVKQHQQRKSREPGDFWLG